MSAIASSRQPGKTTQMLLRALDEAQAHPVIFVGATMDRAKQLQRQADALVKGRPEHAAALQNIEFIAWSLLQDRLRSSRVPERALGATTTVFEFRNGQTQSR